MQVWASMTILSDLLVPVLYSKLCVPLLSIMKLSATFKRTDKTKLVNTNLTSSVKENTVTQKGLQKPT